MADADGGRPEGTDGQLQSAGDAAQRHERCARHGPNGNQIFFPLPGYRNYDEVETQGYYGFYWSSMLNTDYGYRSYYLYLGRDFWYSSDNYCSSGYSVRGVSK